MKRELKSWTPEEDALLREIWSKPGPLKLSLDLFQNRTIHAIRVRGCDVLKLPRRGSLRATFYSWCEDVVDKALKSGLVATAFQLAEVTPASPQRIRQILRKEIGTKYHIAGWEKRTNGGDWTPKWAWGGGESVPKPDRQTRAVLSRKFRARNKLKRGEYNPFAAAAGLISAPSAPTGRVIINLRDFEEAA
jgi:hypothetical protein